MDKKVIISGYYGFDNFGDELILSILVKHLKTLTSNITVLSSNPEKTSANLQVNSICSFSYANVLNTIRQSDILVSGGGSLLQDATSLKSLIYYLGIIFLALLFGKKVIIFAQGIGPIKNIFARFFTMSLLKHCTYICVRDVKSQYFLEKSKINAQLVCDPVFSTDIPQNQNKKNIVGVQLRDFKTLNDNFLMELALKINEHFSDKKIYILSLQDKIDLKVCEKFQTILLNINPTLKTKIISNKTNEEIINFISNLEYLIAMRFHALIIALKSGVKSMGINYDIKIKELALESEIPLLHLNNTENIEQLFENLKTLDSDKIKAYADNKSFDYTEFDKIFTIKK